MKVAVQDCEGWYKDDITGAVQCADTKKYNDYMRSYRARKRKHRDFDTFQEPELVDKQQELYTSKFEQ